MEPRRIQPITLSTSLTKKIEPPKPSIRFVLELTESNCDVCPEFSYPDLIKNALEDEEADSDPFDNSDESKMAAMAEKFERKYGNMKKPVRLKGQGCNINDMGDGYDESDDFIDNSEAYAETVPDTMTTEFGGFYINMGNLELKSLNGDNSSADEMDADLESSSSSSQSDISEVSSTKLNLGPSVTSNKPKLPKKSKYRITSDDENSKPFKKSPYTVNKFKKKFKSFGPNLDVAKAIRRRKIIKAKKIELAKLKSVKPKVIVEKAHIRSSISSISSSSCDRESSDGIEEPLAKRPPPVNSTSVPEYISARYESIIDAVINMSQMSKDSNSDDKDIRNRDDDQMHLGIEDVNNDSGSDVEMITPRDNIQTSDGPMRPSSLKSPTKSVPICNKSQIKSPSKSPQKSPSFGNANPLPHYISDSLKDNIERIKEEAVNTDTDKRKFFNSRVNRLLLQIDKEARASLHGTIGLVYSHLADFLPCSKLTLQNRSKKLRLTALNNTLDFPMQIFTDAVKEAMIPQISAYNDLCKEQLKNSIDPHSVSFPKPEFQWSDITRKCFRDVVRAKLNMYELSRENRDQNRTEYLMYFFLDILSIWPQEWMNARTLYYESTIEHTPPPTTTSVYNSEVVKKNKKSAAAKVSELVKQVTEDIYVGSQNKKHGTETSVPSTPVPESLPYPTIITSDEDSHGTSVNSKDLMPPPNYTTTSQIKKQSSPSNKESSNDAIHKKRTSLSFNHSLKKQPQQLSPHQPQLPSPQQPSPQPSPHKPQQPSPQPSPHQPQLSPQQLSPSGISPPKRLFPIASSPPVLQTDRSPTSLCYPSTATKIKDTPAPIERSPLPVEKPFQSATHITEFPSITPRVPAAANNVRNKSGYTEITPSSYRQQTEATANGKSSASILSENKYNSVMKSNMSDIVLDFLTAQNNIEDTYTATTKTSPPTCPITTSPSTNLIIPGTMSRSVNSKIYPSTEPIQPLSQIHTSPVNILNPPTNLRTPPTNILSPPTNIITPPVNRITPPTNLMNPPTHSLDPPIYNNVKQSNGTLFTPQYCPTSFHTSVASPSPELHRNTTIKREPTYRTNQTLTSPVTPMNREQFFNEKQPQLNRVLPVSNQNVRRASLEHHSIEHQQQRNPAVDVQLRQQQHQQLYSDTSKKPHIFSHAPPISQAFSNSTTPVEIPAQNYNKGVPTYVGYQPFQTEPIAYQPPTSAPKKQITFDPSTHCLNDSSKSYPINPKSDALPTQLINQQTKSYPFAQNPQKLLLSTQNQYSPVTASGVSMFQNNFSTNNPLLNTWSPGNGSLFTNDPLTALQLNQQINAATTTNFSDFYANMQSNSVPSNATTNKKLPR